MASVGVCSNNSSNSSVNSNSSSNGGKQQQQTAAEQLKHQPKQRDEIIEMRLINLFGPSGYQMMASKQLVNHFQLHTQSS